MVIDVLRDGVRLVLQQGETILTHALYKKVSESLVIGMGLVHVAGPTERDPVVWIVTGCGVFSGEDMMGVTSIPATGLTDSIISRPDDQRPQPVALLLESLGGDSCSCLWDPQGVRFLNLRSSPTRLMMLHIPAMREAILSDIFPPISSIVKLEVITVGNMRV